MKTKHLPIVATALLIVVLASLPFALATNYTDLIYYGNWKQTHNVGYVPNPCGSYDHACVYEYVNAYAWDPPTWFNQQHTVTINVIQFSVNPNGHGLKFDVYASSSGGSPSCNPYFAYNPITITNAVQSGSKWLWAPSYSGGSNTFTFNPQGENNSWGAVCVFEPRIWDNGSPTVYTYLIQYTGS